MWSPLDKAGPVLEGYAFLHQVYGQLAPVEMVLKPEGHGFTKRFHAVWQTQPAEWIPEQDIAASEPFLADFFNWMGQVAYDDERNHHFDGYALTMLMAVLRAIDDFVNSASLNMYFAQKLRWADTDLSRYANACMRMRQFIEYKKRAAHDRSRRASVGMEKPEQVTMGICDLAHALHMWRRQMHVWHGYFIHCDATWPPFAASRPASGCAHES